MNDIERAALYWKVFTAPRLAPVRVVVETPKPKPKRKRKKL